MNDDFNMIDIIAQGMAMRGIIADTVVCVSAVVNIITAVFTTGVNEAKHPQKLAQIT